MDCLFGLIMSSVDKRAYIYWENGKKLEFLIFFIDFAKNDKLQNEHKLVVITTDNIKNQTQRKINKLFSFFQQIANFS